MSNKEFVAHTQEIMPLIRTLAKKKELVKDFLDNSDDVATLRQNIEVAKKALADFLETNDDYKALVAEHKEAATGVRLALKTAKKVFDKKPAELKAYFSARAKQSGVEKVVKKAKLFEELSVKIDGKLTVANPSS